MGKKSRLKRETKQESGNKPEIVRETGRFPLWLLVLIAAVAILVLARSIPYAFVYDDEDQILRNTWIRDWSQAVRFFVNHVWAFANKQGISDYYRPFQMVLYAIAYSIGGLRPHVYHLFSILIHALCSVMVALIGFRLSRDKFLATVAGLLFAVHPIHAESVAWISGVTDPLCAIFYFLALYYYLKDSQEEGNRNALILALGFFLGALFSKEMAFTLPVIAGWLDWCLHRRLRWSRYAMFAALFAFYSILRVIALNAFYVQQVSLKLDPVSRVLSTTVLLAQYIAKMFVPYGINAFHVFVPTTSILNVEFALSAMFLAAFAAAAWTLRRHRIILFLFGYSVLTILPVLNFSGIGQNIFADRYLYIPTLGSCLLIPLLVQTLMHAWPSRPRWLNLRVGVALVGVLLVVFAWQLTNEITVWRDAPTLYLETVKRSPGASLIAHSLGRYYFYLNDLERAQEWEMKALAASEKSFIENKPNLAGIYEGLGAICFRRGNLVAARDYDLKAFKETPGEQNLMQNLATIYIALREYDKALQLLEGVVRANPRNEVAYSDLSALYVIAGQFDPAIADARRALDINPKYGNALMNLIRAYAGKGMKEEARRAYLDLQRIDPAMAGQADAELKALISR